MGHDKKKVHQSEFSVPSVAYDRFMSGEFVVSVESDSDPPSLLASAFLSPQPVRYDQASFEI